MMYPNKKEGKTNSVDHVGKKTKQSNNKKTKRFNINL